MQKSNREARGGEGFTDELMILSRHDPEERALACAIQAEHPNLRAWQKGEPDVFENLGVGRMNLPETFHHVDELRHEVVSRELLNANC